MEDERTIVQFCVYSICHGYGNIDEYIVEEKTGKRCIVCTKFCVQLLDRTGVL